MFLIWNSQTCVFVCGDSYISSAAAKVTDNQVIQLNNGYIQKRGPQGSGGGV